MKSQRSRRRAATPQKRRCGAVLSAVPALSPASFIHFATVLLLLSATPEADVRAAQHGPVPSPTLGKNNNDSEESASYFSIWKLYENAKRRAGAVWEASWEAATKPLPSPAPSARTNGPVDQTVVASSSLAIPGEDEVLDKKESDAASAEEKAGGSRTTTGAASSSSSNNKQKPVAVGAKLGHILLHEHGDATGAELTCVGATKLSNIDATEAVEAWTCLGEARLALHQSAYSRAMASATPSGSAAAGSITYEMNMSRAMQKLIAAKDNFEVAMQMDPTNISARGGLGLAMLLMATSGGTDGAGDNMGIDQLEVESILTASTAQLLLDSIQHLEAAANMMASSFPCSPLHLATVHNLAMAHLALGDFGSAVPLLRNAARLLIAGTEHEHNTLTSEEVNLGGALLQAGAVKDAVELMNDISDRYCRQYDDSYYVDGASANDAVRKRKSLCSIVYNNLGVGHEMLMEEMQSSTSYIDPSVGKAASAEANYDLSLHWSDNSISAANLDAALSDAKNESEVSPSLGGHDAALLVAEISANAASESAKEDKTHDSNDGIDSQLQAAIHALQAAALQNPDNARSWVSLSKARAHAGDKVGALEAAAKAVNAASAKEEFDMANDALEEALASFHAADADSVSTAETSNENAIVSHAASPYEADASPDVRTLRLEQEVLSLKLQLLQQQVRGGMPRRYEDEYGDWEEPHMPESRQQRQRRSTQTPPSTTLLNRDDGHNKWKEDSIRIAEPEPLDSVDASPVIDDDENRNRADAGAEAIAKKDNEEEGEKDHLSVKEEDQSDTQVDQEGIQADAEQGDVLAAEQVDGLVPNEQADAEQADVHAGESLVIDMGEDGNGDVHLGNENQTEEQQIEQEAKEESTGNDKSSTDMPDYGSGDDEGLEIGEERAIGEADDDVTTEYEPVVVTEESKQDTTSTSDDVEETQEAEEEVPQEDEVNLPDLYDPPRSPPAELPTIVASYMKIADAYMQKENYKLAGKQFAKIIKKAPHHIPAILGHATALERSGLPKKVCEAALAYGNATKAAIIQGEEGLATVALRRAVSLAQSAENEKQRLETLKKLSELAFTAELAADVYFAVGSEAMKMDGNDEDAVNAFKYANKFSCSQESNEAGSSFQCGYSKSLIASAKLALTFHEDAKEALKYASLALESEIDDDAKIEAHVIAGRAKMILNDAEGAIVDYRLALDLHVGEATGEAHHHLAIALQATGGEPHAIENHFEQALNMGMKLTAEAINTLGEDNIAVRRSVNRQHWADYELAQAAAMQQRGGIMSAGGSSLDSGNSIFASQQQTGNGAAVDVESQSALDMLEEGAAAYDGTIPDGEETGSAGDGLSPGLPGQGSASARARAG